MKSEKFWLLYTDSFIYNESRNAKKSALYGCCTNNLPENEDYCVNINVLTRVFQSIIFFFEKLVIALYELFDVYQEVTLKAGIVVDTPMGLTTVVVAV